MKTLSYARAIAAALAGIIIGSATCAFADITTFRFDLVDKAMKVGPDTIIAVRLIDTKTGRGVPNAVIFATRLDMAPEGMETMATKIETLPGSADGIYRFKAEVSMAGTWRLSLAAKVQGEAGSIDDKLVIKAGE